MIIGFIPWEEFGITFFKGWTDWLTGLPLGEWYFYESAAWFLIVGKSSNLYQNPSFYRRF